MSGITCTIAVPSSYVFAPSISATNKNNGATTGSGVDDGDRIYAVDSFHFLESRHRDMRKDIDSDVNLVQWKCTLDESRFECFIRFLRAFVALIALDVRPLVGEIWARKKLASFEFEVSLMDRTHLSTQSLCRYLTKNRDIMTATFDQVHLLNDAGIKNSLSAAPLKCDPSNDVDGNSHHLGKRIEERSEYKNVLHITAAVAQLKVRLTDQLRVNNEQIPAILHLMQISPTDAFIMNVQGNIMTLFADTIGIERRTDQKNHRTEIHFRRDKTKPGDIVFCKNFIFNVASNGNKLTEDYVRTITFRIHANGKFEVVNPIASPVHGVVSNASPCPVLTAKRTC